MTALQVLLAAGGLVGAGTALLLARLLPAQPDLGQALARLSPAGATTSAPAGQPEAGATRSAPSRVGAWAGTHLPAAVWGRPRPADLAVLGKTPTTFYTEKLTYVFIGLIAGPVLSWALLFAFELPLYIPVVATLTLTGVLWLIPNHNLASDARDARAEFTRALGAFVDLVALEMASGSGPRQAMEAAAAVGDSWVFTRLREELSRTRWSGTTPWAALRTLAEQVAIPDLDELADVMRLSGEDGARVYAQLRARATSMRSAILTAQKTRANEISERMTLPMTLLGVIFLLILITPQLLRMLTS